MAERVVVFFDYQNVQGTARRQFCSDNAPGYAGQIDPVAAADLLVSRRKRPSKLAEIRIYRGLPSPDRQPKAAAANNRQTDRWARDSRVTVIRRPLHYRQDGNNLIVQEKGVDVALAVDLVRMAVTKQFDAAILFSRDTDLMPALETIRELEAAHVEVAGWKNASRLRFRNPTQPLWCHQLSRQDYELVKDTTNYGSNFSAP